MDRVHLEYIILICIRKCKYRLTFITMPEDLQPVNGYRPKNA